MEIAPQTQLRFFGVDIFNVQFNSSRPAAGSGNPVELIVRPRVMYNESNPLQFKIVMEVRLSIKDHFELNIGAVGAFELEGETSSETKKAFVNQNAPAIMFPYVRAFITTFSANLGGVTGPLTVPVQFFKGEVEEVAKEKTLLEPNAPPA